MSLQPEHSAEPPPGADAAVRPAGGQVAIIGCGPSGCYTALALRRLAPDAHITLFDRRTTPFGLIRYGVAPDHQGMKNVSRQFDRLFASDEVHFVGNTTVGEHLSIEDLEANFDVVVAATGLAVDRPLSVPVEPRAHVLAAGQLLRFLNGDPDSILRNGSPAALGADVMIVGAGNVAMDVARLVCKADDGFHGSDVDDDARDALAVSGIRTLTLLSRSSREGARWDPSMYTELCAVPGVTVVVDGVVDERSLTSEPDASHDRDIRVDIRFNETPLRVDADDTHCVVHTQTTSPSGGPDTAPRAGVRRVDTVITAMGFVDSPNEGWAAGDRVERVGGCGSGTLGNLAENRVLAKAAAQRVASRLLEDRGRPGLKGVRHLLPQHASSFADWTSIDRAETARARPNRLRTKFTSWSDMSAAIAQQPATPTRD
ncbi:hypothetical protein D8S82_32285 [Mycobacterium hodleri]|uniref:ferredoxin--NADP(+) reductase n=1 Tax=Mycolicibacterium hodleri TaxID=49897 RepID=A0A544VQY6_9MYCO|nr:FAD-dependent oxidoreductase [Mycolicibacterium hodleri]TQR82401.1 hypothetical protein D8S82_32285 [Mycolicibacterium hodleri]